MENNINIENDIADAIIDRPKGFRIGHRHFYLYPLTLGKTFLQKRIIDSLNIKQDLLSINPYAEALRIVDNNKEQCCLLLSYLTLKTKEEILNNIKVTIRKNLFLKEMSNEDIATLILINLTDNNLQVFVKYLGIHDDNEEISEINNIKKKDNTFIFGGKSVYGAVIDTVCNRYKWTFDYVVWEISYVNLQLLLKDSIKTIYLTDDEMKKLHVNNLNNMIDGNNREEILRVIRETK